MESTPRILVIEDVESLRNDILEMLSFEGFDVQGAENGQVGVDVARDYQPDLIVCDIMMPVLDGYDVLDVLRSDGRTATIPFIFLTAKSDRAEMRLGMGKGADDYVTKPFMAAELLDTIRARLERRIMYDSMMEDKLRELSESIITALPHELRTPLNTIIGFSNMIVGEASRLKPVQITEWAGYINEAGLRLYRLVENYLTYARIEALMRNPNKVASLKERAIAPAGIVHFQAMHKAQEYCRLDDLVVNLANDHQLHISDQDIGKITEELVDNAFKFSDAGTPVTIDGTVEGDFYVLSVTDKGIGMDEAQVRNIDVHVQFDRWLHEQQGTGLGLAIVRRLAELYDGSHEITSRKGEGTTVIIRLPM